MKDILEYRSQRVLVAPLNWGLGHATRCIPIIYQLLALDNEVAIASDGDALDLLRKEFPSLDYFELPSYNIRYEHNSMMLNMLKQAPSIMKAIRAENKAADIISKKWQVDIIISDNRLGFHTDGVENIYMTHQLQIPGPNKFVSAVASRLHKTFIHQYDKCIVPDHPGEKALAHGLSAASLKIPTLYLGPITRFKKEKRTSIYHYSAILSGPEPQRTQMEAEIIALFNKYPHLRLCIVRGSATYRSLKKPENHIDVYNLVDSEALNKIINETEIVICRSGYSSIMDLVSLEKPAIILPTPGQYEQMHLAKILDGRFGFRSVDNVKSVAL